jgi:hypothetical protein
MPLARTRSMTLDRNKSPSPARRAHLGWSSRTARGRSRRAPRRRPGRRRRGARSSSRGTHPPPRSGGSRSPTCGGRGARRTITRRFTKVTGKALEATPCSRSWARWNPQVNNVVLSVARRRRGRNRARSRPGATPCALHGGGRGGGLACDGLHLLQLGGEVERHHLVACRVVGSAVVDRVRAPGLLQRHRGVRHHRGAFGDSRTASRAASRSFDDVDAESVLFERNDGRRERRVVGESLEAVGRVAGGHVFSHLPYASAGTAMNSSSARLMDILRRWLD